MSNSEDQDTSVDYNEKERQHPQIDHYPREVMVQTQRDLELSLKRRSISGVSHKIWRATQIIIQRNISQKKVSKRQFWWKTPRPENLDPVKKTVQLHAGASETEKRSQDIAIDNI